MSIASEITRLQTSKADIKTQVNIDVDDINEGTDFIDEETLDDYADLIKNMQDAYKQYIPIHTKMIAKGNTTQNGTPTPSSPVLVNNVTGEQIVTICGKNRIKFVTAKTSVVAGVTVTCDNNSTFTINGTKTSGVQLASSFDLQPTKLIGQYKFTGYTRQDAYVLLYCKDKNGTIKYTVLSGNPTITFNEGDYLFQIIIYINANVSATFNNETFHFQLEKGNTATPYTPNQEQNFEINLGKNLLTTKTLVEATTNGITFTPVYDGNKLQYVNVNGTATATAVYNLDSANIDYINTYTNELPSGTYILDDFSGSTSPYMAIFFRYYTIGSTSTTTIDSVDNSRKLTIDSTIKYASYIRINNGTTVSNMKFYPQLEKGNTETSYAPYFTPIELNKIGNYQDFIRKGSGKNLINVSNGSVTTNGVTSSWNNNFVQISGTNTKTDANWILLSTANFDFPDFKIGETYTISALGKSNKCYVQINYNVGDTTTQKALVTMSGESKSFIVPEDFGRINFIFIGIYRSTGAINENWYLQLEKGPATSYEPYGYKDKWYIERNVGKVVLANTNYFASGGVSNIFYTTFITNYATNNNIPYSNQYTGINNVNDAGGMGSQANNTIGFINQSGSTVPRLYVKDTRFSTEAELNNWIKNNPLEIYYVLANPTYTLIENEELIEQLDAVQLQTGENNVLVSGDLPMILDLSKYIQIAENHL